MTALARVTAVEHLGGRALRVTFSDGLVRELDFAGSLPGVLSLIDDDNVFATAAVDNVAGTVSWPVGIDLDPDVLHGDREPASIAAPRILREYRLQQTG
jgi:hypothetical protein